MDLVNLLAGVLPKLEKRYFIVPLRFGTHVQGNVKYPLDILDQQLIRYYYQKSRNTEKILTGYKMAELRRSFRPPEF